MESLNKIAPLREYVTILHPQVAATHALSSELLSARRRLLVLRQDTSSIDLVLRQVGVNESFYVHEPNGARAGRHHAEKAVIPNGKVVAISHLQKSGASMLAAAYAADTEQLSRSIPKTLKRPMAKVFENYRIPTSSIVAKKQRTSPDCKSGGQDKLALEYYRSIGVTSKEWMLPPPPLQHFDVNVDQPFSTYSGKSVDTNHQHYSSPRHLKANFSLDEQPREVQMHAASATSLTPSAPVHSLTPSVGPPLPSTARALY